MDSKTDKDKEIEKLVSTFRKIHPTDRELGRWTHALVEAPARKSFSRRVFIVPPIYQLAAALLLGILIGALGTKSLRNEVQCHSGSLRTISSLACRINLNPGTRC